MTRQMKQTNGPSRRRVLQTAGAGVLAGSFGFPAIAAERPVKLGYVSPQTGPLALVVPR